MRRVRGSLTFVLVIAFVAWPQTTTDAPADKEDVQKLFVTMHLRESMQNIMTVTMQQQKQITHDALKKKMPSMTDEELKRMDAFVDEFAKTLDLNGMLDDMVPIYERHLTKQDVTAMLTFYSTPTGQKLLRDQPVMMSEAMQAMRPRMEKIMSDMMDKVEKMVSEEAGKSNSSTAR